MRKTLLLALVFLVPVAHAQEKLRACLNKVVAETMNYKIREINRSALAGQSDKTNCSDSANDLEEMRAEKQGYIDSAVKEYKSKGSLDMKGFAYMDEPIKDKRFKEDEVCAYFEEHSKKSLKKNLEWQFKDAPHDLSTSRRCGTPALPVDRSRRQRLKRRHEVPVRCRRQGP